MRNLLIIAICLFWSATTSAQVSPIDLISSPTTPKPGEMVRITATSRNINLEQAKNRWQVNGQTVQEGDQTELEFFVNRNIRNLEVKFTSLMNGDQATKTWAINDLDLLWEPDTESPVFYDGHTLPIAGSLVKFLALPHIYSGGARVPTTQLIFDWQRNGNLLPTVSGVGRNKLSLFVGQDGRPETISVTVTTKEGKIATSRAIVVRPSTPDALFFEDSPVWGIKTNKALAAGQSFQEKAKFFVGLFNFPTGQSPKIDWQINQAIATTTDNQSFSVELDPNSASGPINIVARINGLIQKSISINLNKR